LLGRDHALLGALAYLGGAWEVSRIAHQPMPPAELAVGAMVCSAFALLPDIDEPHSVVSTKLGPISEAVSRVTNKLSGGHRHATHSIAFVVLIGAMMAVAQHWRYSAVVAVVASGLLVLRMIVPLGFGRRGLLPLVLVAAAGWWAWTSHPGALWLPATAAAGVFLHLVGDMLTREGVPLLWPAKFRIAAPVLGHTDSAREQALAAAMSAGIAVVAWFLLLHPSISHLSHIDLSNVSRSVQSRLGSVKVPTAKELP
jgi:membrane-bound metal-dependent hydrolase YbcI (DUF457 family)